MKTKQTIIFLPLVIALIIICALSGRLSASAESTELSAPTVTVSGKGDTSAALNWTAIPDAKNYVIYALYPDAAQYAVLATTDKTSYTATELTKGTAYNFVVAALNTDGTMIGGFSDAAAVTTSTLPTPLLSSSGGNETSVSLNWTAVAGAKDYTLYVIYPGETQYTVLTTTAENSYTVTGLTDNATYNFAVAARDDGDIRIGDFSDAVTVTTPKIPKPSLTAFNESETSILLSWTAVAGAKDYALYAFYPNAEQYELIETTTETSYTATGLTENVSYSFIVAARDINNVKIGNFSDAAVITARIPAPPTLTAFRKDNNSAVLNWTAVPGAKNYTLYVLASGETQYAVFANTAGTSYTVSGLSEGKTYNFVVAVCDSNNVRIGDFSDAAVITTTTPWAQAARNVTAKFLKPGMSQYEKAKAAFDYIIANTVMGDPIGLNVWRVRSDGDVYPDFVENRSLSVLLYGVGVCEDYAAAYVMLLREMGIEAEYVPGMTVTIHGTWSEHAWTVAKIDGVWYHIDPNLEDNISRRNTIKYKYFMRSSATLSGTHRWGQSLINSGLLTAKQINAVKLYYMMPYCPQNYPTPRLTSFAAAPSPNRTAINAAIAKEFQEYESVHGPLKPINLNTVPPVFG